MIGSVVAGRYRILRLIGEGGMGKVFEAEHTGTGRHVAIKVILSEALRGKDTVVQRFQREARMAAAIDTQHIVQVFDSGVDPETELPFQVMELMKGEDVAELLRRVGKLAPDIALRIAAQACRGLKKAHEAGIIHRDIKPGNLFLARRDEDEIVVKILDFGIAKVNMEELEGGDHVLTQTGAIIGSPLYMSPEQARGQKDLDGRADLWSLGVVLYQLLCGRAPFHEVKALGELLLAICCEDAPPLCERAPLVPERVAELVHRALLPANRGRYQSADEMLSALAPLLPNGVALCVADLVGVSESPKVTAPSTASDDETAEKAPKTGGSAIVASVASDASTLREEAPRAAPGESAPSPNEGTVGGLANTGAQLPKVERRWSQRLVSVLVALALMAAFFAYSRSGREPTASGPRAPDAAVPIAIVSAMAASTAPSAASRAPQTVTVLADSFSGYAVLRRPALETALAESGITLRYVDEVDQAVRARKVGESADFIATTLDQLLLNRPRGRIVALIDATAGADAIVLNRKRFPALTSLLALGPWLAAEHAAGRKPSVAYAAGTPSEFLALLLDARFVSFKLASFEPRRVADSALAFAELEAAEPAAAAVLWEPYVTRAERAGQLVALSSADVPEAIVDVLVASESILAERPEVVDKVVGAYYRRIDADFVAPSQLAVDIAADGKLSTDEAKSLAGGLRFFTAIRARSWLDSGKLVQRIQATAAILVLAGKLSEPPAEPAQLISGASIVAAAKQTEALIALVREEQPVLAASLEGDEKKVAQGDVDAASLVGAAVLGSIGTVTFAPGAEVLSEAARAALSDAVKHAGDFNPTTTVLVIATAGPPARARIRGEAVRDGLRRLGLAHRIALRSSGGMSDIATLQLVRFR